MDIYVHKYTLNDEKELIRMITSIKGNSIEGGQCQIGIQFIHIISKDKNIFMYFLDN